MTAPLELLVAYASEQGPPSDEVPAAAEAHARQLCLDALTDAASRDDEPHADFFAIGTGIITPHIPPPPDVWIRRALRLAALARRLGIA